MPIKTPFVVALILYASAVFPQPTRPINFSSSKGMPSERCYAILLDKNGFIWFGTDMGLSTFDGYSFTSYTMDDGLPDHEIINLFEDSQQRIWLKPLNGKVCFLKRGVIHSTANGNLPHSLNFKSPISGIEEDSEGNIWIASKYDGVKKYSKNGIVELSIKTPEYLSFFIKNPTEQGFLGFGSSIYSIDENSSVKNLFTGLKGTLVGRNGIHDGKVYFVNSLENSKLFRYNPVNQILDTLSVNQKEKIYNIRSVDGQLVLLTSDGIVFCDEQSKEKNRWLKGIEVADIVKDLEGNYWVTSLYNGLFFIPKYDINEVYSTKKGNSQIHTLATFDQREVWFGNNKGVYAIKPDLQIKKKYGINIPSVNSIYFDHFGNNWIAYDHGFFLNGEKITIPNHPKYSGRAICDYRNQIAFSTRNTIYVLNDTIKKRRRNYIPGYFLDTNALKPFPNIYVISPGKGDSLFIGTEQGLFLSNDGAIINLSNFYPQLNGRIYDIKNTPLGLWVATYHAGLVRIKEDSVQQYDNRNFLPSNQCKSIYVPDSTTVWIGTNEGLVKLELKEEKVSSLLLNKYHGLPANQVNDIVGIEERIFVATPNGIATFHREKVFEVEDKIPLFIREILVDGKKINSSNEKVYELEPGVNDLRIKYVGLSYKRMGNIQYQYRFLEDKADDASWQTTQNPEVSIWKPNTGKYYFQVRARKLNGSYTDALSLKLHVNAYLWETGWFKIVVLCLAIFCGWLLAWVIYKNRKSKKELLMNSVTSELKALRSQLNPHFMFNALNSIKSFILNNNQDNAEEYLSKFSKLMRLTLRYSEQIMTSVEKEAEVLSLYIEMELLRISDKFQYTIDLHPEVDKTARILPSMILQPFVENAIWHGLVQKTNDRRLEVCFRMKNRHLIIRIEDNGVGFRKTNKNKNAMGIRLIEDRLKLMESCLHCKIDYQLLSLEDGISGTLVNLKIPVL